MVMTDYFEKYITSEGLDIPKLINDDFFEAIKIISYLNDHPDQKFTAREIAEWIFNTYPEVCDAKKKRSKVDLSDDEAFIRQLTAEVSSWNAILQKRYPQIKITEGRPRKYYFTEITDSDEVALVEKESDNTLQSEERISENSLYPKLSEFLWSELRLYSKRIDEKTSSNSHGSKGNIWLHPDVVGMEDLSADWHKEIKDCVQQYSDKKTSL